MKAQINANVFVYSLTLVIVGIVLFMGYSYFADMKTKVDKTSLVLLEKKISADVKTIGSDFGTIQKVSYEAANVELCMLDLNKKSAILESNEIKNYPLMQDSIQSNIGKNAFVFQQELLDSFDAGSIAILDEPYFHCFKGSPKITFWMGGNGNGVSVADSAARLDNPTGTEQESEISQTDVNQILNENNEIENLEDDLDFGFDEVDQILTEIENI